MQLFITGTDTGIGKTFVTAGLLRALGQRGRRTIGMKPVASGAEPGPAGLRNTDALQLQAAGTEPVAYAEVNPCVYREPIAPHLAALHEGRTIALPGLVQGIRRLAARCDDLLVEGAGGWRVPLGPQTMFADLVRGAGLPVLMVVGLRLGCLNHALLTADAIRADGLTLLGWLANAPAPAPPEAGELVATLQQALPAPLLGVVPWQAAPGADAATAVFALAAARLLALTARAAPP
jgi:dethiobiotin synthetase